MHKKFYMNFQICNFYCQYGHPPTPDRGQKQFHPRCYQRIKASLWTFTIELETFFCKVFRWTSFSLSIWANGLSSLSHLTSYVVIIKSFFFFFTITIYTWGRSRHLISLSIPVRTIKVSFRTLDNRKTYDFLFFFLLVAFHHHIHRKA